MATQDGRSTTLRDFNVNPNVAARDHMPALYPRKRYVRCRSCGVTVPYSVTAEGPIRNALDELSSITCSRYELPNVSVGEHSPTVTPEHPTKGRSVVCESCGRSACLHGDRKRILEELADIPCRTQLTATELVQLIFESTAFTPPLSALGITNWYGRSSGSYDDEIVRQFRHDRFQHTIYIRKTFDNSFIATLSISPNSTVEAIDELPLPSSDPDNPTTEDAAIRFVTFLSATDPLTASEFSELRSAYEDAKKTHRDEWLKNAYGRARECFEERFGATPEAFTDAFDDGTAGTNEILRRLVGSGGFSDHPEPEFAAEMLGHDHEFPGFIDFIAERHNWSPPLAEP